jgi:hypothetical protein
MVQEMKSIKPVQPGLFGGEFSLFTDYGAVPLNDTAKIEARFKHKIDYYLPAHHEHIS